MIDNFATVLCIFLIGISLLLLFVGIPLTIMDDIKKEKEMLAKCKPDPSIYECQLYLAEKGKRRNITPVPIFIPMNSN